MDQRFGGGLTSDRDTRLFDVPAGVAGAKAAPDYFKSSVHDGSHIGRHLIAGVVGVDCELGTRRPACGVEAASHDFLPGPI